MKHLRLVTALKIITPLFILASSCTRTEASVYTFSKESRREHGDATHPVLALAKDKLNGIWNQGIFTEGSYDTFSWGRNLVPDSSVVFDFSGDEPFFILQDSNSRYLISSVRLTADQKFVITSRKSDGSAGFFNARNPLLVKLDNTGGLICNYVSNSGFSPLNRIGGPNIRQERLVKELTKRQGEYRSL